MKVNEVEDIMDYNKSDLSENEVIFSKEKKRFEKNPPRYLRIFPQDHVRDHLDQLKDKIENGDGEEDWANDELVTYLADILGDCPVFTKDEIDFSNHRSSVKTQEIVRRAYPEMAPDWRSLKSTPDGSCQIHSILILLYGSERDEDELHCDDEVNITFLIKATL